MSEEILGDLDLFGDPVRLPSGKRGRPAHEWTVRNSNKVKMLLALGWATSRIANALHCSAPTLRKHYFSELRARDTMRDRLDARRFEIVMALAESGNVAALKELGRMVDKSDMMRAAATFNDDDDQDKPAKIGKKEAAARAAEAAGTDSDWGEDLSFPLRAN